MVQCNQVSTSIRTQQTQSMSEHLRASGNKIVSISSSRVAFCSYKVNSFHKSDDVINLWDFYKRFAATVSAICHNTLLIAFWVLHQAVMTENNLGLLSAADNKPVPENNIKRGWLPSEGEGRRVRRLIRWKRHFFPNQASSGGGRRQIWNIMKFLRQYHNKDMRGQTTVCAHSGIPCFNREILNCNT